MTLKVSKIDLLTLKKLKFWKSSKQLLMCSIRTVLCQNFSPLSLFWKNDLEIFENWPFDLEKIEISKKFKKRFWCVQLRQYCVKISSLYHYFEKNDLEIFENWPFDLEKIRNSKIWKNHFFLQLEEGCVLIRKLYHFFWQSYGWQK